MSEILISPPLVSIAFMAANTISACLVVFFSLMLATVYSVRLPSLADAHKKLAFLSIQRHRQTPILSTKETPTQNAGVHHCF